ncbi:transmembrane protein, putative (macronuclear) [Tetrahymena thermophila SB210]|uniref:Transmembrane protein, putative n=1 Tax=Tetrahymena thermophila (strain SB210) TaxID=312017 RepID=Q234W6_TETTS|nr:transmembrane protein, putative [Tetrahymena thermophila SB210]EAR91887.3 transmembrane protein, putative [Tetrahymena thermophila SB210]|eukprot:XP_001012132.3 transmembrane protein, putative [Tetrahymena thermophila SB210]
MDILQMEISACNVIRLVQHAKDLKALIAYNVVNRTIYQLVIALAQVTVILKMDISFQVISVQNAIKIVGHVMESQKKIVYLVNLVWCFSLLLVDVINVKKDHFQMKLLVTVIIATILVQLALVQQKINVKYVLMDYPQVKFQIIVNQVQQLKANRMNKNITKKQDAQIPKNNQIQIAFKDLKLQNHKLNFQIFQVFLIQY